MKGKQKKNIQLLHLTVVPILAFLMIEVALLLNVFFRLSQMDHSSQLALVLVFFHLSSFPALFLLCIFTSYLKLQPLSPSWPFDSTFSPFKSATLPARAFFFRGSPTSCLHRRAHQREKCSLDSPAMRPRKPQRRAARDLLKNL